MPVSHKNRKNKNNRKNMKGGKCAGGRGKYGTSCYDNPSNCCGKKTKTIKDMLKLKENAKKKHNNKKKTSKLQFWK